jgi:hypothetical protein
MLLMITMTTPRLDTGTVLGDAVEVEARFAFV